MGQGITQQKPSVKICIIFIMILLFSFQKNHTQAVMLIRLEERKSDKGTKLGLCVDVSFPPLDN